MPLPKKKKGESTQACVNRLMGNETMKKEFPEKKQRLAVAYKQCRKKD